MYMYVYTSSSGKESGHVGESVFTDILTFDSGMASIGVCVQLCH